MPKAEDDGQRLEIKLVKTVDEFRSALKIRHDVFGLEGYLKLEDCKGYEYDEYDILPETILMLALVNDQPAGTVRLVMDSRHDLSLNKEFDFSFLRKEGRKLAEGSRFAVLPEFRGNKQISYGLLKADIVYAFINRVTDIISVGNLGNRRGFNVAEQVFMKIGYLPVGGSFYHHTFNEDALPMVLKIENVKEPFRSFMQEESSFIEKPYNAFKFG